MALTSLSIDITEAWYMVVITLPLYRGAQWNTGQRQQHTDARDGCSEHCGYPYDAGEARTRAAG